jgi:hypothetical protein
MPMFTVKFCRPMAATGQLMADIRVWLDKRGIVPEWFHCHPAQRGIEIEISFSKEDDARECEGKFEAVSLVDGREGRHG